MTAPLSPVEALQREADHVRGHMDDGLNVLMNQNALAIYVAALELAKADAELQAHEYAGSCATYIASTADKTQKHVEWVMKKHELSTALQSARAKLYEVLQI